MKMTAPNAEAQPGANFFQRLRRRAALRRQAKQDYQRARGTVHRQMLEEAQNRLSAQRRRAIQVHQEAQQAYQEQRQVHAYEFDRALTENLVHTGLDEIPGIGQVLKARIIRFVFRGRLSDLHQAYRLDGVGKQRQREISRWVREVEALLPQLRKEDFPGRAQMVAAHQAAEAQSRQRVEAAAQDVADLRDLEDHVAGALTGLRGVTWRDFYQVLTEPEAASESVDRYILGVFAAWEPVPDWFRRAVSDQPLSIEEA
jgi:hypothetical protein